MPEKYIVHKCGTYIDGKESLIYDIIILIYSIYMATISVPLSAELQERLDSLVSDGVGANRADVMRRALESLAEQEAINAVLKAEREVTQGKILRGSIRDILLDA